MARASNAVKATVKLGRGPAWFANDEDTLVVADRLDGSITPIDAATALAGASILGSKRPLDGTVHEGRAYIPDGAARTLVEVDLVAGRIALVDRLEGARDPFVAEIAFGDVWVLDYGGQRIWRISP